VEFTVPLRGGQIGRGEDSAVQLSDPAVSRAHCALELRDGRMALVDAGSRNRTVVNGQPITVHVLQAGDEIAIGKTRLTYLPPEGLSPPEARPSRVTIEVGSGELLRIGRERASGQSGRAQRHLAALARLGDSLRRAGDKSRVGQAAREAAIEALEGDRAFLLARDVGNRMMPVGSAIVPDDPDGAELVVPPNVVDKVLRESKAVALEPVAEGGRRAVAAPLVTADGDPPLGLLFVDRRGGHPAPPWDAIDLMAAACVTHLVAAALEGVEARAALARENRALCDRLGGGFEFIGRSAAAQQILGFVGKVGPSDATVLLGGESGSGKELVARAIHAASRRRDQAFIAVNCAALTETLLESELFGHEKGAFTGATERKLGRFELADQGTLFLDEVGELNLSCQTKFLRVLEEQVFERVGGTRSISVDVRVVAATNRDLGDMVHRGQFREDLYYRLSVIHSVVPALRARPDDIPLLCEHFLARLRAQVARRIDGFAPEAIAALVGHLWPGNVRELRNAIEHAIVLGSGPLIVAADLPPHIGVGVVRTGPSLPTPAAGVMPVRLAPLPVRPAPPPVARAVVPAAPAIVAAPAPAPVPRSLRELEREGIVTALHATGGNKAQAAAILEIDRSTLYKKIKDYGID
jgi:DNA-binding NtrC family response regulator